MRLIFFACSKKACDKMQETKERWLAENPEDEIICVVKCKALGELSEKKSLSECTGEWFQRADGLVYFCAAGIAVRSIAPYLVHKSKDPAVVVFDETCRYGISLLSGHLGGANELTERLCSLNGAEPVITTASDREGKIAIDVFAAENGLYITDYSAAKDLEAALLAGEKIGFLEEGAKISLKGKLTEEFVCGEEASACRAGVLVSPFRYEKKPFPLTLQLVPKCVTVGIGCKRGMTKEQIKQAVQSRAAEAGIFSKAICQAASIDLKKEEPGILGFCEEEGLPFLTFSAQTLQEQKGEFTPSAFVCRVTGVDNVCERSAVAASGGKVLAAKRAYEGVTVAFAGQTARSVQKWGLI